MLARVLFALIQCAAMATEVVEVATESEEDIVINCVAIFYEEGKDGENFSKKTELSTVIVVIFHLIILLSFYLNFKFLTNSNCKRI